MKPSINDSSQDGFTLLEVIMVTVIISIMSGALFGTIRNRGTSVTTRHRTASVVEGDVRRAQGMALAGSRFAGAAVCGYGLSYIDSGSYVIFADAIPDGGCSLGLRKYHAGIDFVIETRKLVSADMQIAEPFNDIFFEPPDPKTYINGLSNLNPPDNEGDIKISYVGQPCNTNTCTTIKIFTSGKIEISN